MAKVKIYVDRIGRTLNVWFDKPSKERLCEEIADDVVLVKDAKGVVIGFEQLNFSSPSTGRRSANPVDFALIDK